MSNRTAQLHALNSAHLRATRNALPLDHRHQSIEALNGVVVHLIDVALAAKHAHWNVRGSHFSAYHALFDKVFIDLIEQIDALGERAAALGGIARGTVQAVAGSTQFKPFPEFSIAEAEHIEHIADRLGWLGAEVRRAIAVCSRTGDVVSVDVLTQTSAAVDSLLWLIESHSVRT